MLHYSVPLSTCVLQSAGESTCCMIACFGAARQPERCCRVPSRDRLGSPPDPDSELACRPTASSASATRIGPRGKRNARLAMLIWPAAWPLQTAHMRQSLVDLTPDPQDYFFIAANTWRSRLHGTSNHLVLLRNQCAGGRTAWVWHRNGNAAVQDPLDRLCTESR